MNVDLPFNGSIVSKDLPKKFHPNANIEVLVPVNSKEFKWVQAKTIDSHLSPEPTEEFLRITVSLNDGTVLDMCHPDCIRDLDKLI